MSVLTSDALKKWFRENWDESLAAVSFGDEATEQPTNKKPFLVGFYRQTKKSEGTTTHLNESGNLIFLLNLPVERIDSKKAAAEARNTDVRKALEAMFEKPRIQDEKGHWIRITGEGPGGMGNTNPLPGYALITYQYNLNKYSVNPDLQK